MFFFKRNFGFLSESKFLIVVTCVVVSFVGCLVDFAQVSDKNNWQVESTYIWLFGFKLME